MRCGPRDRRGEVKLKRPASSALISLDGPPSSRRATSVPGAAQPEMDCQAGEEIFILSGDLHDGRGSYRAGTWIRNPSGFRRALRSSGGAVYWVKRGHLGP